MSSINNSEEQPPESPLDFLSRVATMVEKSQTSPATAAILQAPKSADPSTATNLTYTGSNDNNELSSTNSPPPSAENHQNSQNKKCERSPSFKERHPKFRKSSTPDYLLVADHTRTIKLNRQSSLSETSKGNDSASTNSQGRNSTVSSIDVAADNMTNSAAISHITSSVRHESTISQVSSSSIFPSRHPVYTSSYEQLHQKGTETGRPCIPESEYKPMEQDPHQEDEEEEEGPIDFSMKKRPESPQPSPPYRYTPLTLPTQDCSLSKSTSGLKASGQITNPSPSSMESILAPASQHVSVPPPPSYSAATARPPPPPYPSSPSPPLASSSTNQISQSSIKREPPPSYGSSFPSPPNKTNSITSSSRMDYHNSRGDSYALCDSTRHDDRKIREVTIITDSSADPLLDEHFRRALGEKNYESIFNNKKGEAMTSEPKSPPISSSSNADHLSRPTAYSPPSYLHSSTANEASLRASRIDHHGPRSPIHSSSLNSSSSSITSSEISVTRITPKSSPVGKSEQAPYPSEVDVDPVKAFQDDMKLEDEGYTVEDHFAKALGDTWVKLKAAEAKAKNGSGASQGQPVSSSNQTSNSKNNDATSSSSNQKIKSEKVSSSSRSTPTPPPMPKWGLKVA